MAGSIENRGDNKWRLIVSSGKDANGKRIKHTRVFHGNKRAAEKALAQFVAEIEKGSYIEPSKLTLSEFAEQWVRDYAETNLAPKTLFRYKQILYSRIIPALGYLRLEQIKPLHLLEFYKTLQQEGIRYDGKPGGLSERTILHHHRLISALLQDAVEWQLVATNPASRVKPPKVVKKRTSYYNERQTEMLLKAVSRDSLKHQVLIALAVSAGLRRGELMGLEWKDIDFEHHTLEVIQASQYLPRAGTFTKDPKNESSKRIISIPNPVIELLKEYKAQQAKERVKAGDKWQGSERLFTTRDGKPGHPEWPSQWFSKFLKRYGLPPLPFHGLRHTAATLLIAKGIHVKTISSRLGHANISTTMDIYGHSLKSADKEAADKLEHLFDYQHE